MNQTKRALVTGASGYVGHHVTSQLVEAGWSVSVLIRPTSDVEILANIKDRIEIYEDDETVNFIDRMVGAVDPDVIFHVAASVAADDTPSEIQKMIDSNLGLGIQILESMRKRGCPHLVNTGTFWSYSSAGEPNPVNTYAAMKLAMEQLIDFFTNASDISAITLNLGDVYGPNDWRPKLLNQLRRALDTGQQLELTPGDQLINLVHVSDVAAAYLVAAENLLESGVGGHAKYSVSSTEQYSVKNLIDRIATVSGRELPVRLGSLPYRAREIMVPWHGGRLPNWNPKVDLMSGLHELFE